MTIKHLSFITLKVGPYTKRENFLVLDYMELEYIVKIHRSLELCKKNFLSFLQKRNALKEKAFTQTDMSTVLHEITIKRF